MLSLTLSSQPFYVFWQQVVVVLRGDCAGLQETRIRHWSIDDAGHQEQEILTAWLLCKVAILPSLGGRLQIARFLAVLVPLFCLFLCFILCMTHCSQNLLLFHVDRADVRLNLSWGVVYECAVSVIFFVFLLFLFFSCALKMVKCTPMRSNALTRDSTSTHQNTALPRRHLTGMNSAA
jgi:hypothetical protein